jgi:hypothetical protein
MTTREALAAGLKRLAPSRRDAARYEDLNHGAVCPNRATTPLWLVACGAVSWLSRYGLRP